MNISSIVIQVAPRYLNEVIENLKTSNLCDYQLHDEAGRIIVAIEGKNTEEEIDKLKQIKAMPHVASAEMMFSYSEDELDGLRQNIETSDTVPQWLNDDSVTAKQIRYSGELNKSLV